MRQGSDNPKSIIFRTALAKLHSNSISDLTQKLLLTRYKQGLPTSEVVGFNDTTQLYSIRATIGKYNITQLRDLLQPVVAIKLVNTGIGTRKVTPNQYNTLENLTLYIGAKVILIQNIQVKLGLVNSTTGIVKDIIQKEDANIKKDQLQALLIMVDSYNGSALFT